MGLASQPCVVHFKTHCSGTSINLGGYHHAAQTTATNKSTSHVHLNQSDSALCQACNIPQRAWFESGLPSCKLLVNSALTVRALKAINDNVNPTMTIKLTFIDFSKWYNAFSNRCSNRDNVCRTFALKGRTGFINALFMVGNNDGVLSMMNVFAWYCHERSGIDRSCLPAGRQVGHALSFGPLL